MKEIPTELYGSRVLDARVRTALPTVAPLDSIYAHPDLPSPCYLIDYAKLEENCRLLASIQERSGAKILLALKAFAMYSTFPLISRYLAGTSSSGLHEALLGYEEFAGEVHVYSPGYRDEEIARLPQIADHIILNSLSQWNRYKGRLLGDSQGASFGLRINPEYSESDIDIYDPCGPCSRLGIRAEQLKGADLTGIDGLHWHTLCMKNSDSLERTIEAVEAKFGDILPRMKWVNMGGGHKITGKDYDVERLVRITKRFAEKWDVQVYLEPGEAVVLNTGVLVSTVLDVLYNDMPIAILDTSATAHMPDVLEMPYRPEVVNAGKLNEYRYNYRIGGPTCLAGDVVGDYSFPEELKVGDRVVFKDMAQYTMVKNTTFNAVPLPAIAIWNARREELQIVKRFGYEDYKWRLS